ncbi:MAG: Holliday junction branch migration protein RuvA [Candidatus Omnitrophota bacterium]|nr:Holliday junction branch migration protein RuvA [Candidatus Omnitrophota bacterium]
MIIEIEGKLARKGDDYVVVDIQGISYQILVAPIILEKLHGIVDKDGKVKLVTYHYMQQDPSKSIPVLIGFLNEIEKDFFEKFITVSGIGPKAALRALSKPIPVIAKAIDDGDMKMLCGLPGIGEQRAKEIIAKLQGKVAKYGLIQDTGSKLSQKKKGELFKEEALEILLQLEYKRSEAENMIEKALLRSPHIETTEALLNEVYKQRKA